MRPEEPSAVLHLHEQDLGGLRAGVLGGAGRRVKGSRGALSSGLRLSGEKG